MIERLASPWRILAALSIALVMTAHVSPALAAQVQVQDDTFSPAATFIGPAQSLNPFGGTYRRWELHSVVDKASHQVTHFLYVDTSYTFGRRGWAWANDDHAGEHRVVRVSFDATRGCRRNASCIYDESVAVELDDAFVRDRPDGFQIKLTARSGDTLVLNVVPAQIAPVLDAVDAYLAKAGPPAAANVNEPAPFRRRHKARAGVDDAP